MNSPNRKKLNFKFSYRDSKDSSEVSNVYSPGHESNKYSGSAVRSSYSPKSSFAQLHSPQTNLIEEVVLQCRRIDPEFSVNVDNSDYNNAAMQTVRKAVDTIINHQQRNWGSQITEYQETIAELKSQLQEAMAKNRFVNESENKLRLREEKLALDEVKINAEKKMILNEKTHMSSAKKHYLELESDIKQLKEELKAEKMQNQVKEARIHELFNENLEKETIIEEMRSGDIGDLNKLKYMQEQIKVEAEKLSKKADYIDQQMQKLKEDQQDIENKRKVLKEQFDLAMDLKQQLENELSSLDENKRELANFRVDIELEQTKLKDLRKHLENDKSEIEKSRASLEAERTVFEQDSQRFKQEKSQIDAKLPPRSAHIRNKSSISIKIYKCDDDFEVVEDIPAAQEQEITMDSAFFFPELKKLVDEYTQTIAKKQGIYELRWQALIENEAIFNSRLEDIQLICALLEKSQEELSDESSGQNDLGALIEVVKELISDLSTKQHDYQAEYQRLFDIDENFDESEDTSARIFLATLAEFESKALELQELECSLHEFGEKLHAKTEDNSRIALVLREERIKFAKERAEKQQEIELAGKDLMELQAKLDTTIDYMNRKEKDLMAMQQVYDITSPFSEDLSLSMN